MMNLQVIEHTVNGLAHFLHGALLQQLEPIRLARVGCALLASGCSLKGSFPWDEVAEYLVKTQHDDGGWNDVEETIWCLSYLSASINQYKGELIDGKNWLASVQHSCGAWGESSRDQPRIPVTSLVAVLLPEVVSSAGLEWVAKQWEADLSAPTQLTYKGAFFLLAQANSRYSCDNDLVNRTIAYLTSEQEEDGGFGPWKGHPAGSDPWTTGVALWGLSKVKDLVSRQAIERALSWLQSKQLPNGLWTYHYLDDGTAMALIGVSSVLPILREY